MTSTMSTWRSNQLSYNPRDKKDYIMERRKAQGKNRRKIKFCSNADFLTRLSGTKKAIRRCHEGPSAFFHAQRKIRRKHPSVLQAAHMEKRQRDSAVPFHAVHEPLPA